MAKKPKKRINVECGDVRFDGDESDEKSMEELQKFVEHVLKDGLEKHEKYHEEERRRKQKD